MNRYLIKIDIEEMELSFICYMICYNPAARRTIYCSVCLRAKIRAERR